MFLSQHAAVQELKDCSDEDLLVLYHRTADGKFFAELFSRHVHLAFRTCFKYLKNFEESKDQVMNIFHKILETCRQKILRLNSFKQWLQVFIRNECTRYRKRQRCGEEEKRNFAQYMQQGEGFDVIGFNDQTFDLTTDQIRQALKRLPKEQQQCLYYFFYQKMSYKAIANQLDLNLKEVKSHLQNGKRKMKKLLIQLSK